MLVAALTAVCYARRWNRPDAGWRAPDVLDNAYTYSVDLFSRAGLPGLTEVTVWDDDVTPGYSTYRVSGITPLAILSPYTYTAPLRDEFRIVAAQAFALWREYGFATNQHYISYAQGCNVGGSYSGVCCHSSGAVYQDAGSRKYIIGHELGHCLFKAHNGGSGCDIDYAGDSDADGCDDVMEETLPACASQQACGFAIGVSNTTAGGHQMNSREYQSSAIYEGFAHFYAAHTWNNATSDCKFQYYKGRLNWDGDGSTSVDERDWNLLLDCEDGLPTFGVDGAGYLEDYCGTSPLNRGVEYDWLRMFWDLRTDESVAFDDVLDILVDAECDNWNDTENIPVADRPWERLEASATDNFLATPWASAATQNGVDH